MRGVSAMRMHTEEQKHRAPSTWRMPGTGRIQTNLHLAHLQPTREDKVKFRFIHAKKASISIAFMCRQLGVSRAGYYAWAKRPESQRKKSERELTEEVAAVHRQSRGTYGRPRVHAELRARGLSVSERSASPAS